MLPETMISVAYTAMAAAQGVSATSGQETFIAAMHLGVALIYLFAPYLRRD
jgi:hypothetical protein